MEAERRGGVERARERKEGEGSVLCLVVEAM